MRLKSWRWDKARKYFFFEKKKQKTFDYSEPSGTEEAEYGGARRPNTHILLKRR
jgi:hypothetical protein